MQKNIIASCYYVEFRYYLDSYSIQYILRMSDKTDNPSLLRTTSTNSAKYARNTVWSHEHSTAGSEPGSSQVTCHKAGTKFVLNGRIIHQPKGRCREETRSGNKVCVERSNHSPPQMMLPGRDAVWIGGLQWKGRRNVIADDWNNFRSHLSFATSLPWRISSVVLICT